ncbi:MAG TPA: STAS domain-containing protein [Streptosporangiaceae bacterium]|nr:STAS domain-containing protein [Streptosporangiaceae bacterium]
MPGQQTCAPPVIVTLPARLDAAAAGQAAGQITAAFTPGVSVVIADLTAAACCDRSAIRNLLKAHRQATARGGQVRFVIRPGGPLHQITGFAGTHPLLAVYPTLQHALTGRSPIPPGNRGFPATANPAADVAGPGPAGRLRGGSGSHGMFSRTPRVVLNETSRIGGG